MKKKQIDPIVKRTMIAFEFNQIGDISNYFKKSRQNVNNMINRGTFLNLIEAECFKRKLNIEWIRTGQGEMTLKTNIAESLEPYKGEDHSGMPLRDVVKMQFEMIFEMQKTINKLQDKNTDLHKRIHDLAGEIGEIKTNMYQAAKSGDINRLWIGPLPDTKISN